MKIRPVGAELFLSDGKTGMAKLIYDFSDLANAAKNVHHKEISKRTFCKIQRDGLTSVPGK